MPGAEAELANRIDHTIQAHEYRLFDAIIKTSIYNVCGNLWIPAFAGMMIVRLFRTEMGIRQSVGCGELANRIDTLVPTVFRGNPYRAH